MFQLNKNIYKIFWNFFQNEEKNKENNKINKQITQTISEVLQYIMPVAPIRNNRTSHIILTKNIYASFTSDWKVLLLKFTQIPSEGSSQTTWWTAVKFTRCVMFALERAYVHDSWLGSDHFISYTPHLSGVFQSCMLPITSWHVLISRITNLKLALTQRTLSARNHD